MKPRPFFEKDLHDALPAIEKLMDVAGGQTALAIQVGTSGQTIANVREARRVSNSILAHRMGDLAAELGWPAITSRVLSGMVEWDGEQTTDPKGRKRPNGSGSRPTPLAARQPAGGSSDAGREARAEARRSPGRKTASRRPSTPICCWSRSTAGHSPTRVLLVGTQRA